MREKASGRARREFSLLGMLGLVKWFMSFGVAVFGLEIYLARFAPRTPVEAFGLLLNLFCPGVTIAFSLGFEKGLAGIAVICLFNALLYGLLGLVVYCGTLFGRWGLAISIVAGAAGWMGLLSLLPPVVTG